MKLIRPFRIGDAALVSSSIGGGSGVVALAGDMTDGDELLAGDENGRLLYAGDEAAADEWDAEVLYALGTRVQVNSADYHHAFESLSGGESETVTITIATPGVVSWTAHGLAANTQVTLTTTGALPTGLAAGAIYYVRNPAADTFELAATSGGSSIATSGAESGVHTATANPNLGKVPADNPGFWLDLGATNRWAMFDQFNTTRSAAPERINVVIQTTGRIDALALLNIAATSITVVSTSDGDEVFNQTYSLISTDGITDWWSWFFEDIIIASNKIVLDLPPYIDQRITVTLEYPGAQAACGVMVLGRTKVIGGTMFGASVGITDYSRKEADVFGNYAIVERPFSKRGDFRVMIRNNRFDDIYNTLAQYRATPVVWLGTDSYGATHIFGFFKQFSQEISYPLDSLCSLEIEGLT